MLEAKDTIMGKEQQVKVWLEAEQKAGFLPNCAIERAMSDPDLWRSSIPRLLQKLAEVQADITWEASKRATQEHILKYLKQLSKNYPKISLAYTIGLIEAGEPDWRETE